jgi:hypothetical protein
MAGGMGLFGILLTIALIGVVVYLILLLPLPSPFPQVIVAVAIVFVILWLLGVVPIGLPTFNLKR